MTQPKLLCIGKPHVQCPTDLASFELDDDQPEITHILDFRNQVIWDEEWILVTGDRGRRRREKGEPLPRVCVREGVTHVILSAAVQCRKSFSKMLTVLSVWYELMTLQNEPTGSRFVVYPKGSGPEDRGKGILRKQTIPDLNQSSVKRQYSTDQSTLAF